MPTELMKEYFLDKEELKKIQMRIVLQAAPFLKGMKESALINVPNHLLKDTAYLLKMLSISCHVLYKNRDKTMLFLYHEEMLQRLLNEPERQAFLRRYGYGLKSKEEKLKILASHMESYYRKSGEFPHEIGVFLGYPQKDVEGFIANGGKNYLLSGYWKVYENEPKAKVVFEQYDRARERAVYQLLSGMNLNEIAAFA